MTLRAALLLMAALLLAPASATGAPFPWRPLTLEQALEAARRERKPVVVDVYAEWCEPCKRLDRLVFGSPEVGALAPRFIAIRVDGDKPSGKGLTSRYKVERYPTSLMLRSDGSEWGRIEGFRELPGYLETLRAFLDGRSPGARPTGDAPEPIVSRFAGAFRRALAGEASAADDLARLEDEDASGIAGVRDQATLARAELLVALGKPQEAQRLLERLLGQAAPALTDEVTFALARAHAAAGDPARGAKLLERRARKAPDPAAAAWRLAHYVASTEGAPADRALRVVEALLARHPEDTRLLDAAAALHERAGQYDQALGLVRRARQLHPDLPFYQARIELLEELRGTRHGGPP